jgi:hypothetical protein
MTALKTPAPDAPAPEWGRLAVSISGWRWMPGMAVDSGNDQGVVTTVWRSDDEPDDVFVQYDEECPAFNLTEAGDNRSVPDPDDPATAGCLLALHADSPGWHWVEVDREQYGYRLCSWMGRGHEVTRGPLARNPGRACIAAAAALGRWLGGEG